MNIDFFFIENHFIFLFEKNEKKKKKYIQFLINKTKKKWLNDFSLRLFYKEKKNGVWNFLISGPKKKSTIEKISLEKFISFNLYRW